MEVKIQIPDNCELIKDGDTYIVREKKNDKPRSWEEFCKNYPRVSTEYFIETDSEIVQVVNCDVPRDLDEDRNTCISKQEAEAFLALMQLRQLRKAWVGDWKQPASTLIGVIHYWLPEDKPKTHLGSYNINRHLSFLTLEMARDFLNCFKDLCETAKTLL